MCASSLSPIFGFTGTAATPASSAATTPTEVSSVGGRPDGDTGLAADPLGERTRHRRQLAIAESCGRRSAARVRAKRRAVRGRARSPDLLRPRRRPARRGRAVPLPHLPVENGLTPPLSQRPLTTRSRRALTSRRVPRAVLDPLTDSPHPLLTVYPPALSDPALPPRPSPRDLAEVPRREDSGVRRSHAWRPSCGIPPCRSTSARTAAPGRPVRGTARLCAEPRRRSRRGRPARPRAARRTACPSSTTTAIRGSLRNWAHRLLWVIEYSHSAVPSQTNQSAPTCGAPSPPTVATRQVR